MRRFDKKKNIQKANLLAEQRYLESKGSLKEDVSNDDSHEGFDDEDKIIKCPGCDGEGYEIHYDDYGEADTDICADCGGEGKLSVAKWRSQHGIYEEDGAVKDKNTGENLNIGDVVKVDGLDGLYQVAINMSVGKPYLAPYNMETKKADVEHKIYLTSIINPSLEKVVDFSDTRGGFGA